MRLMKKIFTNEDGSTGHLYLITNDLETDGDGLLQNLSKNDGKLKNIISRLNKMQV
ncbi:hypothetical protein GW536_19580 (plasmid) [Piscirickettsia salmonis]|nr:hypothetical protein [Piscirickettsia salmonis]QIX57563.1 hypothetical protein GW536_19580 [Piscirickettsia salmonis]